MTADRIGKSAADEQAWRNHPFGGCDCSSGLAQCTCAAVAAWQAAEPTRNARPSERSWQLATLAVALLGLIGVLIECADIGVIRPALAVIAGWFA